jgi:hypothetical protein
MSLPEYHTLLANLAGTRRIALGRLLAFAAERKIPPERILGEYNQLIPPKSNRRNSSIEGQAP